MVTRENNHYGVSNSTRLSQLLTLGKPTVISTQKSMFAIPKHHHQSFTNSYHVSRSLTEGDGVINGCTNSDQPLDFSVKKSSSNGSAKQEILEEPTPHCFTPSPSPPDNISSANSSNIFLSPDNTLSNILPLVDTGTLPTAASLPVKTTLADTTITVSPTSPPLYAESGHNALLLSSMHHPHAAAIPRTAFPTNFSDNHAIHANDSINGGVVSGDSTTGLLRTVVPLAISPVSDSGVSPKQSNKFVRPFKAYPRDPLKIPLSYYSYQAINSPYGPASAIDPEAVTTESILAKISEQKYKMFREMFKAEKKATEHKRNSTLNKGVTAFKGDSLISSNSTGDQSNSSACSTNSGDSPTGVIGSTDDAKPKTPNMGSCNSVNGNTETILDGGRISNEQDSQVENSSPTETNKTSLTTESRKRPSSGRTCGDVQKDEAYWERRRKNNEAAKRSRDARRQKEDEITIRATFLEHENRLLRMELAALRTENERLKCQFYASGALTLPAAQFSIGLDAAS